MGKNPVEAKKNREQNAGASKSKKVLCYFYVKKPNGALGLKKEWRMMDLAAFVPGK